MAHRVEPSFHHDCIDASFLLLEIAAAPLYYYLTSGLACNYFLSFDEGCDINYIKIVRNNINFKVLKM